MGTVVLLLAFVAIAGTAALFASCLRLASAVSYLLAAFLLGSAEIVAVSLLLSPGRWLTRGVLVACVAILAAAAVLLWLRLDRPRPPVSRATVRAGRDALGDPVVAALAALVGLTYLYLLVVGVTVPQSMNDTLLYHLPRAAFWQQQDGVAYVPDSPDARIDVFPPNAEIEVAASMILSRGDRFVALVQLASAAAAVLAIVGIARRFGYGRRQAAFGALAFASFTIVVLQAPTALNDLAVMSFLVIAAFFAAGATTREFALGALALALAVGTKGTVWFALPALAVFALAVQPPRRWLSLLAFGVAGIGAGSYWYVVNLWVVGHASGGTTLDRGTDSWLHRVGRYFADLFELSNGDGASLLDVPRWRFLVFAACAAAVVAVLTARRRRGLAGWIGLGAVLAVLAAPLVITWIGIAHRVGLHLLSAFGIETASLSRLPEGFYESSMHSSYGLAFVLLFLASIALVLVSARRRLVTAVPQLAALAAVPLMVLASSAVLAYDSMRMRYLAFGVALASATFGIVLRVRAVAWIAVGLACVNTAVLVAYFVPRPAGLALLTKNRALDTNARWWVQGNSGNGDPDAFRFLEERVPAAATVALALRFNTYVYPAWDAGLRRTVRFVPEGGDVPASARWLVLGPGKELEERSLAGWKRELASPGGWRIYSR